jgi:hypothetical protein
MGIAPAATAMIMTLATSAYSKAVVPYRSGVRVLLRYHIGLRRHYLHDQTISYSITKRFRIAWSAGGQVII